MAAPVVTAICNYGWKDQLGKDVNKGATEKQI
jgi:hypothetical protein